MPLVRITVVEGTPAETRRALGEGVHRALVECAGVPKDDRFQVIETAARTALCSRVSRSVETPK